jgi:hypothetical protein
MGTTPSTGRPRPTEPPGASQQAAPPGARTAITEFVRHVGSMPDNVTFPDSGDPENPFVYAYCLPAQRGYFLRSKDMTAACPVWPQGSVPGDGHLSLGTTPAVEACAPRPGADGAPGGMSHVAR